MISARKTKTKDWTPRAERHKPESQRATIQLCTMPVAARAHVTDHLGQITGRDIEQRRIGSVMLAACRYGISGWTGIYDEDGNPWPCQRERDALGMALTDESLEALTDCYMEAGAEILAFNRLADDDEGNSESPQSLPAATPSSATDAFTRGSSAPPAAAGPPSPGTPPAQAAAEKGGSR